MALAAPPAGGEGGAYPAAALQSLGPAGRGPAIAGLIPFLPLLGCILAGVCAALRVKSKLPAWIAVGTIGAAFVCTLATYFQLPAGGAGVVKIWDWINFEWARSRTFSETGESVPARSFVANFSFYIDALTVLWMLFVTGLATLIALYASEYMAGDRGAGYCRFYAAFCLFVFAMSCLVMGDNLVLLYLGWEGVGLCSYLLIGYFYKKPSAVAAAKKAFILNRIGDLGLALGIMLTFVQFGTVEYAHIFPQLRGYLDAAVAGDFASIPFQVQLIPILFTIGAFGKSAQIPLYVWLPDAMEGPTPVSALIHAATMVTAGVYLIARFLPVFFLSEWALWIVAWGGTLTALLAATIGMAQFDIKRIMAYSTVSQLGYMFAAVGVVGLASAGGAAAGVFHVFTHAFFKALLFLSCGAVMHGFAGQLDLRKLSGVAWMSGWGIVGIAMLVGCLNLAGFPLTAGYFSKDSILAEAFSNPQMQIIGWLLLLTAGLTAYYTFRVFFRVFVGPKYFEPGDEVHAHGDHGHGPTDHLGHEGHGPHGLGAEKGPDKLMAEEEHFAEKSREPSHAGGHHDKHGDFHPHAPGWAINFVLATLAVASIVAVVAYPTKWVKAQVDRSTTGVVYALAAEHPHEHATILGFDPHAAMYYISAVVGFIGIGVAFYLHLLGRRTAAQAKADSLLPALGPIPRWAQGKWYVDELYNTAIDRPLRVLSHIFHLIDKLIVDGLVNLFGWAPRGLGRSVRPSQSGVLHDYAGRMLAGVALIVLLAMVVLRGGGGAL